MKKLLFILFVGLLLFKPAISQKQSRDSMNVLNRANEFIYAFNNFQWENFRNFFADDAVMFHPQPENARRVSGRNEVEATWIKIFPEFIDTTNKETLNISPKDIHIQMYRKTAIVSFHLPGNKTLGRRSMVWVKQKHGWKIVHLHASTLVL